MKEIIKEINSKTGKRYNADLATVAVAQILGLLQNNEELRASAKHNTFEDFERFVFWDAVDDALLDCIEANGIVIEMLRKGE